MNKQTERMYYLLAICLVLHPQRIDESVLSTLKENYGDKLLKMQRGYVTVFFVYFCINDLEDYFAYVAFELLNILLDI